MPRSFLNVRVKWLWSKKPVSMAMSAMGLSVVSRSLRAALSLAIWMYSLGGISKFLENARLNVLSDILARRASESTEMFEAKFLWM